MGTLREVDLACIQGGTHQELVAPSRQSAKPGQLPRNAIVRLRGFCAVDQGVALFCRFVVLQALRDAAPKWKWRAGGVRSAKWVAGVSGCGQRIAVVRTGLVKRLVQGSFVDIAIQRRTVQAAVIEIS